MVRRKTFVFRPRAGEIRITFDENAYQDPKEFEEISEEDGWRGLFEMQNDEIIEAMEFRLVDVEVEEIEDERGAAKTVQDGPQRS